MYINYDKKILIQLSGRIAPHDWFLLILYLSKRMCVMILNSLMDNKKTGLSLKTQLTQVLYCMNSDTAILLLTGQA